MRLAIAQARAGMAQGQWPYGACLVKDDEVVSCAHNVTRSRMDPTAHAEIQAIREGGAKLQSLDLTGCELYTTCAPCPMCFSACHHASVSTIIYGVMYCVISHIVRPFPGNLSAEMRHTIFRIRALKHINALIELEIIYNKGETVLGYFRIPT